MNPLALMIGIPLGLKISEWLHNGGPDRAKRDYYRAYENRLSEDQRKGAELQQRREASEAYWHEKRVQYMRDNH